MAVSQAAAMARDHREQQPGKGSASAKSHGLDPSQLGGQLRYCKLKVILIDLIKEASLRC